MCCTICLPNSAPVIQLPARVSTWQKNGSLCKNRFVTLDTNHVVYEDSLRYADETPDSQYSSIIIWICGSFIALFRKRELQSTDFLETITAKLRNSEIRIVKSLSTHQLSDLWVYLTFVIRQRTIEVCSIFKATHNLSRRASVNKVENEPYLKFLLGFMLNNWSLVTWSVTQRKLGYRHHQEQQKYKKKKVASPKKKPQRASLSSSCLYRLKPVCVKALVKQTSWCSIDLPDRTN